ncbi:hypothetical protein AHMF7605_01355 [Adhaeribacter arboris]|uniref:Lipoprotein SmpA/OmlA domain-containing protein n=1 Tax=Adhaeribacter arboris TaxID=2072846 RepID=A0A2T2Y9T6_9BACT|nr:hypothetical protein [Adhaeribacter arboris]PSR52263.1 hypothetical protein AHMF7605_01355 [Adhaeribacter arboris]
MKKALETTFIVLLFFFALVGVAASVFAIREFYFESKYSELYIKNCQKVKVGIPLEEAKVIMGGMNYNENEKSYNYWTSFEKGKPKKYSIDYPTSSSSYHTVIYYDPETGLVTEVECSGF